MSPRTAGDDARSSTGLVRRTLLGERDRPLLVLVTGAAGTGKTARAAELLALARDARVSHVDLSFTSARGPLVRSAVGVGPPPDHARRDDVGAWRDRLAREVPALLVVEDVQRAPDGFVSLVRDWVERAGSGCVTVVTARPEELADPELPLGPGLALPAALTVRHERLTPWPAVRVRDLVHARLGPERCPRQVVARIARLSGGNVQVVADLLELLGAAGPADEPFTTQDVDALGVPARLAQLTATRLAALPSPARVLVAAAAVLDGPAGATDLADVAELSLEDAEAALPEAGALLAEDARGDHGFAVPLAAAAVRDRLPGHRRRRLHLRAADVLGRREPVPWVHVAEHRRRGGATEEWLRAVEHAAGDAGAFADPESVVDAVRPVLAAPEIGENVRARLALRLSRNAILTLPSPRTVAVLREIVGLQGLAPGVRGEIRLELGVLLHKQLNRAEGWVELERAIGELRERPALLVRAMTALANPFQPGAGVAEHESWLSRAEQVADDDVSRAAVAAARTSLAVACGEAAPLRRVRPPRAGLDPRHNEYLARGLTNTAVGAVFAGRFPAAGELLDQAGRCADVLGAPFFEQCDRGTRLLYDFERGAWDGLAERCRGGMSDAGVHSDARLVLVQLAVARGDWAEAEDVWPGRDGFAFVPYDAAAAATRARMALAQGRVEEAVATVEDAWESLADKGIWVWAARLAPIATQTWLTAGVPGRAAEAAAQFAAGLRGRNSPMAAAALRWTRALLADGDPASFERASALYARLAAPYPAALALEDAAGPQHLEAALETFTRLGAAWDATRVRGRLRALKGDAAPPRGRGRPAYDDTLSPREREVAELASGGMTNRAIAETLHLSQRTVEHHVSRAMQKSGTRSRRALPAALESVEP
ncbi:LuxR C-terminal-related transcriptional regulator [Amycolatopsis sp., V23-08]|uniref:LuxR C-terminal-related transcriptional regulator n=1 Tax=Amycolatopsis heterodermiae TaxID=3110235 RepID=A0ABU5RBM9_9PSEU|nr:LuxR C-terminal-related transcriptional regulator [Amycolatopsis sp., V23-08]MEA5363034.1 LuxR C-terminal-related transcriptional regulator [Amycolatopsis sp., V23-08]